jgi:acyl-CoA thioesterase I
MIDASDIVASSFRALRAALAVSILAVFGLCLLIPPASAKPVHIVALGDSLTAGYLLPADAAFPTVLEKALRRAGYDVAISNAGVSGDTAEDGLARLDWSVPDGTDGVILELGANDMLRGLAPTQTRQTLDSLLEKLTARHIKVLIAGMKASPSLGADYGRAFDAIYPGLAQKYRAPLYPFFLQGVTGNRDLELSDGLHPNPAGVQKIVASLLPVAESFVQSLMRP